MKRINYLPMAYWSLVCLAFAVAVGSSLVKAVDGRKIIATTPCLITPSSCPKCMMYAATPPITKEQLAGGMSFFVQNSADGGNYVKNGSLEMPCYRWAYCLPLQSTASLEKSCKTKCEVDMEPTSCVELERGPWNTEFHTYQRWIDTEGVEDP